MSKDNLAYNPAEQSPVEKKPIIAKKSEQLSRIELASEIKNLEEDLVSIKQEVNDLKAKLKELKAEKGSLTAKNKIVDRIKDLDDEYQEISADLEEKKSSLEPKAIELPRVESSIRSLLDQKQELFDSRRKMEAKLAEARENLAIAQRPMPKGGFGSFLRTGFKGASEKGRVQAAADLEGQITELEQTLQTLTQQEQSLDVKIAKFPTVDNVLKETRKEFRNNRIEPTFDIDETKDSIKRADDERIKQAVKSLQAVIKETNGLLLQSTIDRNDSLTRQLAEKVVNYEEELKLWQTAEAENDIYAHSDEAKKIAEDTRNEAFEKAFNGGAQPEVRQRSVAPEASKEQIGMALSKDFLKAMGTLGVENMVPSEVQRQIDNSKAIFDGVQARFNRSPVKEHLSPLVSAEGRAINTFAELADAIAYAKPKDVRKIMQSYVNLATAVGEGATLRSTMGAELSRVGVDVNNPETFFASSTGRLSGDRGLRVSRETTGGTPDTTVRDLLAKQWEDARTATANETSQRISKEASARKLEIGQILTDLETVNKELAAKEAEFDSLNEGGVKETDEEKFADLGDDIRSLKKERAELTQRLDAEKAAITAAAAPVAPEAAPTQPEKPKGLWGKFKGWLSR
ncbi:MAG: hypothetical protein V1716_00705 [Candidatus Uhrbacteria bacterium]